MSFTPLCRGLWILGLATITVACSSPPPKSAGPTAEQVELQNVKTSLTMVRHALKEMADDRDRFQDLYLSSDQELVQRKGDVEFLESQARHQIRELSSTEQRTAEFEAEITRLRQERQSVAAELDIARQSETSVNSRVDTLSAERDELKRQLSDLTAENSELDKERLAAVTERDRLAQDLNSVGGQLRNGEESATERFQGQLATIQKLQGELDLLRPLSSEVATLRSALAETEAAKKTETDLRIAAERQSASAGPVDVSFPDVQDYFVTMARRSVANAKEGTFDAENMSLFGLVLVIVCVALVALVALVRGRRTRKRLKVANARATSAERDLHVLQSRAQTAAPARTISAPPEMVRPQYDEPIEVTQQLPSIGDLSSMDMTQPLTLPTASDTAPLPSHVPEPEFPTEDMTQMLTAPSSGMAPLGGATELIEPGVTEDLGDAVRQAKAQSASDGSDDDLLRDLQRVIDSKLS